MSSLSNIGIMHEIVGESGTQTGDGCLFAVSVVAVVVGLAMLAGVGAVLWSLL